jgi:hypothetical protein
VQPISLILPFLFLVRLQPQASADWQLIKSTAVGMAGACAISFAGYSYFKPSDVERLPPGTLIYINSDGFDQAMICTLSLPLLENDSGASATIRCDRGKVAEFAGPPASTKLSRDEALEARERIYDEAAQILRTKGFSLGANSYEPSDLRTLSSFVFVKTQD